MKQIHTQKHPVYIYTTIKTSLGEMRVVGSNRGIVGLFWEGKMKIPAHLSTAVRDDGVSIFKKVETQITEYVVGNRKVFDIELDPVGTIFQKKVWKALENIPYGKTVTYADIARNIGNPKAVRAVGSAIRSSPCMIIVPCHRVIGSSGALTGYIGGLQLKKRLLELEKGTEEA